MKFDKYQDSAGDWRWRLLAKNGRIVADSAEGYGTRRDLSRAIRMVINAIKAMP